MDRKLPDILLGYRTSPQGSTKHSPFRLLYGRAATLPIDNKTLPSTTPDIAGGEGSCPRERHQEEIAAAHTNILRAQERQKREYAQKLKPTKRGREIEEGLRNLQPGDLIAVKNRKKHTTTARLFPKILKEKPGRNRYIPLGSTIPANTKRTKGND
eukprot:jgi/Botrbrau1/16174/Bobra.0377s0002.1